MLFATSEVTYPGHLILATIVRVDTRKIQAILDWPQPLSLTFLKGFLRLVGYYRKFICVYGQLAAPLTNMLK